MRACPFDAIRMSADNLPIINKEKCTACGKCVAACPKQVIELAVESKAVVISCHSRDKGIDVKKEMPGRMHRLRHLRSDLPGGCH